MAYDNICKYLAEQFPDQFSQWLLGERIPFTQRQPSKLSTDPIRADSLIFLQSPGIILHLEFQTDADADMPLRLLDYWVRLRRKYPQTPIRQVVLYLRQTRSQQVYQTQLTESTTQHRFHVVRLWGQKPEVLQQYVGLLPFVILSEQDNPEVTLRIVNNAIGEIADRGLRAEVKAATSVLAGLRLEAGIIRQILGSEFMKESSVYQEWVREAQAQGIQIGEQRGI